MFRKFSSGKFSDLPLRLGGAVLTALVLLLPLFLSSTFLKFWFFALLLICLFELGLNVLNSPVLLGLSLLSGASLFWLTDYSGGSGFFLASVFFLLLYLLARLFLDVDLNRLGVSFFYTFYLVVCFISLTSLIFLPRGKILYLFLLLLVWIGDTAAYFVGLLFGHRKVASQISPHKTWEGVIGGFVLTLLAGMGLAVFFGLSLPLALGAALLIGLVSPVGDFIESSLKRNFNLKDSGFLFPGHGGALDRFDSLLFSALLFLFYLRFLGVWR